MSIVDILWDNATYPILLSKKRASIKSICIDKNTCFVLIRKIFRNVPRNFIEFLWKIYLLKLCNSWQNVLKVDSNYWMSFDIFMSLLWHTTEKRITKKCYLFAMLLLVHSHMAHLFGRFFLILVMLFLSLSWYYDACTTLPQKEVMWGR